ncbi:MAG: chorismate-binding protein [Ignavibacterium sp.]|nr:chorismate-binding protein [Ignavibacterium sp.]
MHNYKLNIAQKRADDFILSLNDDKIKNSSVISFIYQTNEINFYSALTLLNQNKDNLFYYSIPENDFYIAASGEVFSRSFKNVKQLNKYSEEFLDFNKRIAHNFESIGYYPPLLFYSAKFPSNKSSEEWSEFEPVKFFIPEVLLIKSDKIFFYVISMKPDSVIDKKSLIDNFASIADQLYNIDYSFQPYESKPSIKMHRSESIDDWKKKIDLILSGIAKKEYDKIVLSRVTEFELLKRIGPSELAFLLDKKYPGCFNFIYKEKNTMFFSASPEMLFILKNGEIHTEALAGSIERGNNEQEDKSLETALIKSSKDNDEHLFVLDHLKNVLNKYCQNVKVDKSTSLKKLSNIQHLHTKLNGSLKNGLDLFSVIKDIFPTPAVGGYPVTPAINIIDKMEDFDRGLFTGFIGWMNLNNGGEFIVSIRSGLISKNKLYVYAGCGIVPGSDAKKEYEETQLKSEAIISLFDYETKN